MSAKDNDNRKFERYDTEVKIFFQVTYDVETKVEYEVLDKEKKEPKTEKHPGLSKNVSAEGLCFISDEQLKKGDLLHIEVYLPQRSTPIEMQGEVRWSQPSEKKKGSFDTGVQVITVNDQSVEKSVYQDLKHKIMWSIVLESVLGNFRILAQNRLNLPQSEENL
jgi:hypothetical protein